MTANNDVLAPTEPYRLLGYPTDLDGHLRALGALPIPAAPTAQWRSGVADLLEESGLAGRGGASFPASIKLALAQASGRGGAVVVNGMEGEPASHKDRVLLRIAPHLVLDGAHVLAAATGAGEIVVCIPEGRDGVAGAVVLALDERVAHRINRGIIVRLVRPPDRFVAGEESALVAFMATGLSLPAFRPNKGTSLRIGRGPALVHNAETLAHVGMIARFGPQAFRRRGIPEEPGTSLITLSGDVEHPGVVEVDRGVPLRQIVARAAPRSEPQALLVGGYGGAWVAPEQFTTPYASLSLRTVGASAGVGMISALGPDGCGVTETARIAFYMAGQSSGQCGPCVYGLPAIADDLAMLARGTGDPGLMIRLQRRLKQVNGRGACRHPDGVVGLVRSALRVFAQDVVAHEHGAPCDGSARPSQPPFPAAS